MRTGSKRDNKVLDCKFAFILLTVVGILVFYQSIAAQAAFASGSRINCDPHIGGCTQSIGDVTVTLEITPRPVKALQDLLFRVTLSGSASAKAAYIDLGMPAMKMGPNRVMLNPTESGRYEGRGVIVKCASGRRTWFALITVPGFGEAKFVFDVVY